MIGVADDPSRSSPPPGNDPLRPPVAIGDERGARRRGLPSAACGRGISVTCRDRCPCECHRHGGESDHVASPFDVEDRKSTRLNSSHLGISYAVFCLKKKKTNTK